MSNCFLRIDAPNADTLIVTFAGYDKTFGGIPRFVFFNFLETNFKNVSKQFYADVLSCSYHNGIYGVSKNIDQSVVFLRNAVKGYKNVIFVGISSGGYAAILFGSLLNISSVVAFVPQTIKRKYVDEKYRDLNTFINTQTKYYLYGNTSISDVNSPHNISHCERIEHHPNVILTKVTELDLKKLRDSGELYSIFKKAISLA